MSAPLAVDYSLSRSELARGLRNAPGFRQKLWVLAALSVPTLLLLAHAPQFEWWMAPPMALLLAFRAHRVPARAAARLLPADRVGNGSLQLNESGVRATGLVEAKARWSELRAFGETSDSFQVEFATGEVVVLPKRDLSEPIVAALREQRTKAPAEARWPTWAVLGLALVLAALVVWKLG